MPKLRILLAYDDWPQGESLRALINGQLDMRVVAEAANPHAAADCAREERPDVVLLDLALPEADTPAAVAAVRRRSPHSALLVLTTHDDPAHLAAALAAGATGFVVKPAADQELLSAIRAVHGGRTFIDVDQAPDLAATHARRPPPSALGTLSPRERQVLLLVVRGFANREIALRLRLSVKTVETHRSRIARKLGIHSRAELVEYALLAGLLTSDPLGLSDTA